MFAYFDNKDYNIYISKNDGKVCLKIRDIENRRFYENSDVQLDSITDVYGFVSYELNKFIEDEDSKISIEENRSRVFKLYLTISYNEYLNFQIKLYHISRPEDMVLLEKIESLESIVETKDAEIERLNGEINSLRNSLK